VTGLLPEEMVERAVQQQRLIAVALMAGVAIFAGVTLFLLLAGEVQVDTGALPAAVLPAAALGAIVLMGMAPIVQRKVSEAPAGADGRTILERWRSANIVGLAIREGAGLTGIALSLVAGSVTWLLAFTFAALATMALAWPTRGEVEERLRRRVG